MALTQSQMVAAVADRADLSRADAKRALDALDEIVLEELGNAQKVRLGGLVQLTVRVKPATKKRTGRNPATGEEITIAAKPASVQRPSATVGKGQGGASVGAEGAAAACGVKRTRLAIAPARLDQRPNAKPDKRRLRGPRQRMRSFGVTAPRLQPQPPLSRPTIRDGRPRRPTSSFCAVWLSSTSGSHAVATPNGRRARPQQSRARRWRRHRRRQFSHPRIAVRIRQSPASLPAVVQGGSRA